MDQSDFEGTLVLEKLAAIGEVDAFFDAVDSDDFAGAKLLLRKAGVDDRIIRLVLKKIIEADGEH